MLSLLFMLMDLPSSDQDSSEGPTLIPIVGNNTERGLNQYYLINNFISQTDLYTLFQGRELACIHDYA